MSGASVIFYGRRSRSTRSFDDLGFGGSSSSSVSDRGSQNHRHHKTDLHRRCRRNHTNLDEFPRNSPLRSPVAASEPQQDLIFDSPSRNIISREARLNERLCRNDRLPAPVLLAKERLLQRLRGVSLSGSSSSEEPERTSSGNDFREADTGWETSHSRDQPPVSNFSELPQGASQHSGSRKSSKKLPGLTEETLAQLHYEIYQEHQNDVGCSTSTDCSICLENFIEGNELISLACGHRFHTECLYPWLHTCGECPNCRSCIMAASHS